MQYYGLFKDGIGGSRGRTLMVGASIPIHCLALRVDVLHLQCTSLAVVGMTCHNFCSVPIVSVHTMSCFTPLQYSTDCRIAVFHRLLTDTRD